jgi:KaiC/GvpD/RAD55 family RecA-like ATPase
MFREIVENSITYRGRIVPAASIYPTPADHLRYCSLFMFGSDIHSYVKTNGNSVKGYKGKVYADAIWIDIDDANSLENAQEVAVTFCKRLNTEYQINPECLFIYFSGGKGFHIAIHPTLIGFNPSESVKPEKVKDFVKNITNGLPCIDLAIIEAVRLFRVENSKHEKSGLYKLRLSYSELQCDVLQIKNLAEKPRSFPYKIPNEDFKVSQTLNQVWVNSGSYVQEQKEHEYSGNLFQPPKEGARNKTLLIQACTLFRKSELSTDAIRDIVSNAAHLSNTGAKDFITEDEIKRIVTNAQRLVGDERKKISEEEVIIKSFGEWVPDWERYTLQEKTNMSLCFNDLNNVVKGRLKGKLGVVIGYGGSKKSLYALNVCLRNMSEAISIYSTMEMSIPQLMDRIIDHEVRFDAGNASQYLASVYKNDVNEGRKFLVDQLSKEIGNNIQLTPNGRMTYDHYKKAIHKVRETTGNPSILVVDGLSMMGGKGTETEVYSRNSADLKELANEENIFILLICHVSKGAEKHTRDLSRYIRGSEKILDNCDFYMTMSQIQDLMNPETYVTDKGFVNFHDKRGSGKTVDLVYNFEPTRLRLTSSPEDPKIYYEPVSRGRKQEADF